MDEIISKLDLQIVDYEQLTGYDDPNYRVRTAEGDYILKIYRNTEDKIDLAIAENEALFFLGLDCEIKFPKPVPFADRSYLKIINIRDGEKFCRLFTFLEI